MEEIFIIYHAVCNAVKTYISSKPPTDSVVVIDMYGPEVGVTITSVGKKKALVTMLKFLDREIYLVSNKNTVPSIVGNFIVSLFVRNKNGAFMVVSEHRDDSDFVSVGIERLHDVDTFRKLFRMQKKTTEHADKEEHERPQTLGDLLSSLQIEDAQLEQSQNRIEETPQNQT